MDISDNDQGARHSLGLAEAEFVAILLTIVLEGVKVRQSSVRVGARKLSAARLRIVRDLRSAWMLDVGGGVKGR